MSIRLAVATSSTQSRRTALGAAERTGDRAAHRGDRVGVAAVVARRRAPSRRSRRRSRRAGRARSAAPRSRAAGSGCARSGPARRSARRPSRTARTPRAARRGRRTRQPSSRDAASSDGLDRRPRSRPSPAAAPTSTIESTVASGRERLGHRGREHARRLAAVARLVRAGEVDRLGVRAVRVAGVGDADRRDVHRRAAVDDVADAGLARVDVAVAQLSTSHFSARNSRW